MRNEVEPQMTEKVQVSIKQSTHKIKIIFFFKKKRRSGRKYPNVMPHRRYVREYKWIDDFRMTEMGITGEQKFPRRVRTEIYNCEYSFFLCVKFI